MNTGVTGGSTPVLQRGTASVLDATLAPRLPLVLRRLAWSFVPLGIVLAVAGVVDGRTVLGEPVWVKPLKFSVSIALYAAALAWLLDRVRTSRPVRVAAAAACAALLLEQVLISVQAGRGVRSHFNNTTSFDAGVFTAMGALVLVVWAATLVVAVACARHAPADPVTRVVAVAGTWVVLLGASVGFVLVANHGHSVGAPDGGPGLPLVGWDRTVGDLRPGHFVGLHALQVLIAVAWVLDRGGAPQRRLPVLRAVAAAAAALTVGLTGQALLGRSVSSWSTVIVIAVALGTAGLAAATGPGPSMRPPRRRRPLPVARVAEAGP